MLKHLENLDGLLRSIDGHLGPIAEVARTLLEKGLLEELVQLLPEIIEIHLSKKDTAAQEETRLEQYLDKEQVKDYLGIKETAYYRWIKQGKLKPRGGKGQHKYYLSDIRELMEQRKYRYRG